MRIKIRINPKKMFARLAGVTLVILGTVRAFQYPDMAIEIICLTACGLYGIKLIENEGTRSFATSEEQLEELTAIIWENSELSLEEARDCAEFQLKGKSNTDYQVVNRDELIEGLYFGVFKSKEEDWFTSMFFVEPDEIYMYDSNNKKLNINKDIELIAVDMNSFVADGDIVSSWKEKYKNKENKDQCDWGKKYEKRNVLPSGIRGN